MNGYITPLIIPLAVVMVFVGAMSALIAQSLMRHSLRKAGHTSDWTGVLARYRHVHPTGKWIGLYRGGVGVFLTGLVAVVLIMVFAPQH